MERYWDCSLCRIEDKGKALRCRSCYGKLRGRDRLLRELTEASKTRRIAGILSGVAAGLGQIYARRWLTGLTLAIMIPLSVGLVAATWNGYTYGHLFIVAAAVFVLIVAALDASLGPRVAAAPCQQSCPAHLDIPDYLQLMLDGEYEQGHSLIRTRIPLVGVIGRICPHPCEIRCIRGIDGEPISINGCKRFLSDKHRETLRARSESGEYEVVLLKGAKTSAGVIGAGPAGIACAYFLNVLGSSVTVYEAEEVVGGRLATTIPDYRLPPFILDEEIENLRERGVAFSTASPVGPDGTSVEDLLREHATLFVGVGAQSSMPLAIPGAEAFVDFQELLKSAKLGRPIKLGKRVAVVGGGNAAMDVCRTALRQGAEEVHLIYRRSRAEMPARDDEVEEVIREGVRFHFLTDPVQSSIVESRVTKLRVRKMTLGEPDATGRPRPIPVPGEDWDLDVDDVIPALGQRVGGGIFEDPHLASIRREEDGRIWVESRTQKTSLDCIYAGGDVVTGPGTAVQAMAQGRNAALAMYAEMAPREVRSFRLRNRRIRQPFSGHSETPQAKIREEMPKLSLRARRGGFREVEEGFREDSACREAGRCLQCHREL